MAENKMFDAVIIGGGASGMMCAVSAKLKNKSLKVAVVEKNDRLGKKLLSTGNGRCNLTNKAIKAEKYEGSFKAQAEKLFKKFTSEYLLNIFSNLGLITYCDNEGRIYPKSKQASTVLDVLRFACDMLGVTVFCSENIKSVKKSGSMFSVLTENYRFNCDKLVIACGSKAAPKLGGNSSSADYLKNFGHRVIPFSPALCPLLVKSDVLKSLKGIRVTAAIKLTDNKGNVIKAESGEVQFSEKALSGICIFNLSVYAEKGYSVLIDLLPDYSDKELFSLILQHQETFEKLPCENLLTGIFAKRLAQALLKISGITEFSKPCKALSKNDIARICATVKNMTFPIIEKDNFTNAQCAIGGVYGKEIDENTMESKLVKGLYICGEAIDLCGECGGFNLHFAFSSGYLCGESL